MARNDWNLLPGIIESFKKKSTLSGNQIVRGAFLKLAHSIAVLTPVDEGVTRGNWYATTEQPSAVFKPDHKDKNKGYQQFSSEIAGADALGSSLFLTNNSPNILVLENGGYLNKEGSPANGPKTSGGYSKQAPAGMVTVSLNRFAKIIKEEARDQ